MRRLAVLLLAVIFLAVPTGIAYGACNPAHTGDTLERELERRIPVLVVDRDGNPLGCGRIAPHERLAPRQYDPTTGTFTSVDPMELRNEFDLDLPYTTAYHYAYNRPGTFTDPSGECVGPVVAYCAQAIAVGAVVLTGAAVAMYLNWWQVVCEGEGLSHDVAMQIGACKDKPRAVDAGGGGGGSSGSTGTGGAHITITGTDTTTTTREEERKCRNRPGCSLYHYTSFQSATLISASGRIMAVSIRVV